MRRARTGRVSGIFCGNRQRLEETFLFLFFPAPCAYVFACANPLAPSCTQPPIRAPQVIFPLGQQFQYVNWECLSERAVAARLGQPYDAAGDGCDFVVVELRAVDMFWEFAGDLFRDGGALEEAEAVMLNQIEGDRGDAVWPEVVVGLQHVAMLYKRQGRNTDAIALLQDATEIVRGHMGERHAKMAAVLTKLGGIHQHRGDIAKAEELIRQGIGIAEDHLGVDHQEVPPLGKPMPYPPPLTLTWRQKTAVDLLVPPLLQPLRHPLSITPLQWKALHQCFRPCPCFWHRQWVQRPVRVAVGMSCGLVGSTGAYRALCTRCARAVRKVGCSPPPGVR